MEENLIAAIELGSSEITGVVGQKLANGTTEVLAYVSLPSESAIRHGVVYNTEKAASIIVDLIERMRHISACDINMVYVAHNGKSLRSLVSEVERVFEDNKVVDESDVFSMLQECENKQLDNKSRLFLYPQEFTLDNKSITETDPIGVSCKTIKGNYLSVTTNANVTDDVERVFQRASVVVADSFVSIISAADYLLTEDDKQQGCALVDFGADTTTLAIYKNGILKYLRVLP
ncbi:MAG: cell division protein FtsA, partial [Bacteroidaceae bacterium]|nr:cell division protein FtsA [Bacteroidaceae bacterium]